MKLLKGLAWVVGGLAVAWAIAFFGLYLFAPRDVAPPSEDDLLPALERVPDEQNTVSALIVAASKLALRDIQPRMFLDPQNWSSSEAGRLITANEEALKLFAASLERPKTLSLARRPEFESLSAFQRDAIPERLLDIHRLGELMLVRAELKTRAGDYDSGWQDMLMVARVGARLRRAHGLLVEYEVGASIEKLAFDRMRAALERSRLLPAKVWRSRLGRLETIQFDPNDLRESLKTEYRYQRLSVESLRLDPRGAGETLRGLMASTDPPTADPPFGLGTQLLRLVPAHYAFAPNRTLEQMSRLTRALTQSVGVCKPPGEVLLPPPLAQVWKPNSVGENLTRLIAPRPEAAETDCAARLSLAVLQTEIALRIFKLDQVSLPPSLEAMVPGVVSSLPFDPYTRPPRPLEYDPQQKNLRSQAGLLYQIEF